MASNSMVTPKLAATLNIGGVGDGNSASGSKLAFSGPPPSVKAGHGSAPAVKHASKQTDLFAAFHIPKSRAEGGAAGADGEEIDLT
jgi:hypothetical protein